MQRITTATRALALFGVGKDGFRDGDMVGGVAATDLNAAWFNNVQEELLGTIENAGLVPDGAVLTQLRQAIDIMLRKQAGSICAGAGTVDAITGDFTPDVTAYTDGMRVHVRAAGANTSTTPTFKPDALAAKTIVKGNGQALVAGDIAGAGHWLQLQYDLALDRWVLLNPATAVTAFGFGQTVQNMLPSRAWSTTYTNTTGRPIFVNVAGSVGTTGAAIQLTVNTLLIWGTSDFAGGSTTTISSVSAIVPPGGTYSVGVSTGAVGTLAGWVEIR